MTDKERKRNQEAFIHEKVNIIVATASTIHIGSVNIGMEISDLIP